MIAIALARRWGQIAGIDFFCGCWRREAYLLCLWYTFIAISNVVVSAGAIVFAVSFEEVIHAWIVVKTRCMSRDDVLRNIRQVAKDVGHPALDDDVV